MEKDDEEKIKNFRFVKRKFTLHYSIINNISTQNYFSRKISGEKTPQRRKNTRKKTLIEQEQCIKKLKEIYTKNKAGCMNIIKEEEESSEYNQPELDYASVQNFLVGGYDEKFQKMLQILTSPYKERNKIELEDTLSFLIKTKINETLKTDMLLTELTIPELYEYFKPYIFGKKCNFLDTIYYSGEEADNLYLVLYGSIGQYKLEIYEEEMTCEEYFIFLSDCYTLYEEEIEMGYAFGEEDEEKSENKKDKIFKSILLDAKNQGNKLINKNHNENENENEKNIDTNDERYKIEDEGIKEQYIDHYLICQMVDENKDIFPLKDISDLIRLKKIIFKLKLYTILNDSNLRDAQLLYAYYEFPLTYLNFDKVLDGLVPLQKYFEILSNNFKEYDYFYLKFLGQEKHKVKLMKYVKSCENSEPYSYFGNFELINFDAKRYLTARCESEKCVLLCIDKKMYSFDIYKAQKKKRDKELDLIHSCHLFKNISKNYFKRRIFSNFQITNYSKDKIIFRQNEKLNNFIFLKEGILELSLQNISFAEFYKLIKAIREIIINKAKECKINLKHLFDFNDKVDTKSNYNKNTIKEILDQKQNFIFQRNENGIFGDYELFFNMPTLLTGTVISDKCLLYLYDFDDYNNLNYDTYLLNESLKHNSFTKLKSLLKRMIIVYNSYWRLSMEQLSKNLQDKERMFQLINKDENKHAQTKINLFNSINLRSRILLNSVYNNYKINDRNINSLSGLSTVNKYNFLYKGKESNKMFNKYNLFINSKINKDNFLNTQNNINDIRNNNSLKNNKVNCMTLYQNNNSYSQKSPKKTLTTQTFSERKYNDKKHIVKIISNDEMKEKGFSVQRKKNKSLEKDLSNEFKTVNEEYQKKLINTFKKTMNAQHVASKKEKKKIFLPPINYTSKNNYSPVINTEVSPIRINSYINKYNNPIYFKSKSCIKNSKKKLNEKNISDSLIINEKSMSIDKIESVEYEDNIKIKKKKNKKKLYDGVKASLQKNNQSQSKTKKKIDVKLAQLFHLQFRKDKKNNSNNNSSYN